MERGFFSSKIYTMPLLLGLGNVTIGIVSAVVVLGGINIKNENYPSP